MMFRLCALSLLAIACLACDLIQVESPSVVRETDKTKPSLSAPDRSNTRGTVTNPLGKLGGATKAPARGTTSSTAAPARGTQTNTTAPPARGVTTSSDPLLAAMASKPLRYTRHGECRMECRHIDESEVKEMLAKGKINKSRTRKEEGRCTTYAVEGKTHDRQNVRLVFAACDRETKLVTAIDLGKKWPCGPC